MKKLNILAIAAFAFLFSCGDADKKNDSSTDSTAEAITEVTTENNDSKTETVKSEETGTAGVIKIEDIKSGDKIEGLTVTKVEYIKNESYSIDFEGEFKTSGTFSYDEYDEMMYMAVEKEALPKTKISIAGTEYPLYETLGFINSPNLEAHLGQEDIYMIKNGEGVSLHGFKVANLSIGMTFDKGRQGMGYVKFLKQ